MTNEVVAAGAGVTEQWIVHRTGVPRAPARAPRASASRTSPPPAGRGALENAGVAAEDLDLVLVATLAADTTPNCAPLVAHDLGATGAGAMDVSAACTGFLSALALATAQVGGAGRADNVLVIGADVLSRFIDPTDRGTAALFADGAGAAVVTPRGPRRPGPHRPHRPPLPNGAGRRDDRHGQRHEPRLIRMQGHEHLQGRRAAPVRGDYIEADPARPASRSTTSACSSTTRRTRASSLPSASGSASTTSA